MGRLIKGMLLGALVVGGVWLAVIVSWQQSRTLPTGTDIALYMVALPVAALLVGWLAFRALRAWRTPKPAAAPAVAGLEPATTAAATPKAVLLGSAAECAVGDRAAKIIPAALTPVTQLDTGLTAPDGFPILAARVGRLSSPDLRAAAVIGHADPRTLHDADLRAGALLRGVIDRLLAEARLTWHAARTEAIEAADAQSVPDEEWPIVRLQWVLPARWSEATRRRVAESALRDAAAHWPESRLRSGVALAGDETQAFEWLSAWLEADPAADDAELYLVASCDSLIDAREVAALHGEGALLTPARPAGRMPGESAAGVLLARERLVPPARDEAPATARGTDPTLADKYPPLPVRRDAARRGPIPFPLPDEAPRLVLAPGVRRERSADQHAQSADAALTEAARALLARGGVTADTLAALISDADHRGVRPLEPPALAAELAPHLAQEDACLALGPACGYSGAAGALMTVALAGSASQSSGRPTLALTVQDPLLRHLALFVAPTPSAA